MRCAGCWKTPTSRNEKLMEHFSSERGENREKRDAAGGSFLFHILIQAVLLLSLLGTILLLCRERPGFSVLREPAMQRALAELLLDAAVVLACIRFRPGAAGKISIFLLFLSVYLHQTLLSFLAGGTYFLILLSGFLFLFYGRKKTLAFLRDSKKRVWDFFRFGISEDSSYLLALVYSLPLLLVQMNRINLSADYDSLRYGIRPQYVLLGQGNLFEKIRHFFDGMGMLNSVYLYPKGFELLSAPLAGRSYAFLLMMNVGFLLTDAFLINRLVGIAAGKREAAAAVFLLFTMASFTNMSGTAKPDLATTGLQLLMLYCFLTGDPFRGMAAAVLSFSFKPTSFVFTTIGVISLLSCRIPRQDTRREAPALIPLAISLLFTGFITFRTFLLTGVPVSTTYTALFKRLGFRVRWPYNFDAPAGYGSSQGKAEAAFSFVSRFFHFLFCPVGREMSHVRIAFGGVFLPVLLLLAFRNLFLPGPAGQGEERLCQIRMLRRFFLAETMAALLTFYLLWQMDGNYYELWEAAILVLAFSRGDYLKNRTSSGNLPESKKSRENRLNRDISLGTSALLRTGIFLSFFVSLLTSWGEVRGFTPIQILNRGWYDNAAEFSMELEGRGLLDTVRAVTENPENRVLAFAETPSVYRLPCTVTSITDVEGSGGNPGLYDRTEYFCWYLRFAGINYIYIEKNFLNRPEEKRASEMLYALCDAGILMPYRSGPEAAAFSLDQDRLSRIWDSEEPEPPAPERVTASRDVLDRIN